MKQIKPKVFLIAQTRIMVDGTEDWLIHLDGLEVENHITGSMSEKLVELAARRCYKAFKPGLNPNVTKVREDSKEFHKNILKSGHGSVLEHASATFAFEDVSRVFTHELVRHRAGCAYSQESLRYVRLGDLKFFIPSEIEENEDLLAIFIDIVSQLEDAQGELARYSGIDNLSFDEKKKLTSAFRRIAPMGLATGIVATFNMRALRHIIVQRTSPAAEEEIRMVFKEVGQIAVDTWPYLFQDFSLNGDSWVCEYGKV